MSRQDADRTGTEAAKREQPAFSVLLPVYAGDRADWLRRAYASITSEQDLPPDEVVLVRDGPVPEELEAVITRLREQSEVPVQYVPLPQNLRLAGALSVGLDQCSHEIVARADADDICFPQRFARQIPAMTDLDLLGSAMVEFGAEPQSGAAELQDLASTRSRPETAEEIRTYAAFHNPFNHPSIVFRKSAVRAVGGYQDMPLMEDYWLFVRMIADGARVGNVAEPLVAYRVGEALFERRGGLRALRSDLRFQRGTHALGITTRSQYLRNVALRAGYRLVPGRLRAWGYDKFVADREERRRPVGEQQ